MRFFFSYSRKNDDAFLRSFFDDLNEVVQTRTNGDLQEGFFDQRNLELGDFWEPKLETALQKSRVLIAAVTPALVASEWCSMEWGAFEDRLARYAARRDGIVPPVILPLMWIPSPATLPQKIADRQYRHGDPHSPCNTKGLKYLCKLKAQLLKEYTDFVEDCADKIVALGHEFKELDAINETTPQLAWPPGGPVPPLLGAPAGPSLVHFVFGAALSSEIGSSGKRGTEGYDERGERWQPYLPARVQIGTIARQTATLDAIALWPQEMSIGSNLPQLIRAVESRRELVVLFVDGWTAQLPRYCQTLQSFDRENYINCTVLVPWNDADVDTTQNSGRLQAALNRALQFRVGSNNPLYYRGPIRSEQDLRVQLADVLTRLRAEIINRTTPAPGSVPPPVAKPVISGPIPGI